MSVLRAVLGGVLAFIPSCSKSPEQYPSSESMTTEELIMSFGDAPVGVSIGPIARSLSGRTVYVGTDQEGAAEAVKADRTKLRFMTAQDNEGNEWAYAYTTQAEFERLIPSATPFIELGVTHFFEIVERDNRFRGIFVNAGSESSYPIPRELFDDVKNALGETDGG